MARKKPKTKKGKKAKMKKVMDEWKKGTLKSGGSGKKVTSQKQAVAIGLNESGQSKKKRRRKKRK